MNAVHVLLFGALAALAASPACNDAAPSAQAGASDTLAGEASASPEAQAARGGQRAFALAQYSAELRPFFGPSARRFEPAATGFVATTAPNGPPAAGSGLGRVGVLAPLRAGGAIDVRHGESARLRLGATWEGARADARGIAGPQHVLYTDAAEATDYLIASTATSVEALFVLKSTNAPRRFELHLDLPAALHGVLSEGQGGRALEVRDVGEQIVFRMPQPFAVDSAGLRREVPFEWNAAAARLTLALDADGMTFPVAVDPTFDSWTWSGGPEAVDDTHEGAATSLFGATTAVAFGGIAGATGAPSATTFVLATPNLIWNQVHPTLSPPPRSYASMAYDPSVGRSVLFGGIDAGGTPLRDVWEWDGTSWTAATPPPAMVNYSIDPVTNQRPYVVWDSARAALVIAVFDVTGLHAFARAGGTWTTLPVLALSKSDAPRGGSVTVATLNGTPIPACNTSDVLVAWIEQSRTLYCLPPTGSWQPANVTTAGAPFSNGHTHTISPAYLGVALTAELGQLGSWLRNGAWGIRPADPGCGTNVHTPRLVFSRTASAVQALEPTCQFNKVAASQQSSAGETRALYTSSMAASGRTVGFRSGDSVYVLSALAGFNTRGLARSGPPTTPTTTPTTWPATASATYVQDTLHGKIIAIEPGGRTARDFDGTVWSALTPPSVVAPAPATAFADAAAQPFAAYDGDHNRVLFGGSSSGNLYAWTLGTNQISVTTPAGAPTVGANMAAYLNDRHVLVAFVTKGDTLEAWQYDGSQWSAPAGQVGPPARSRGALAYFAKRKSVVLFGGVTASQAALADSWEWDGAAWTEIVASTIPLGRYNALLVPNAKGDALDLYGGLLPSNNPLLDPWTLRPLGGGCKTTADCGGGACVDDVCCTQQSCGTCETCNGVAPGRCTIVQGREDRDTCDATSHSSCDALGQCRPANGTACTSDNQCASGFCTDGVCCDSRCDGACLSCSNNLAHAAGQCLSANPAQDPTCGQKCIDHVTDCGAYVCRDANACATSCQSVADCADPYVCVAGTCRAAASAGPQSGGCTLHAMPIGLRPVGGAAVFLAGVALLASRRRRARKAHPDHNT